MNIAKGCVIIPKKYDTVKKVQEYCKKKGIEFVHERWVYKKGK